ncbi:MAG: hypothetical protein Tsb002_23160 [Wenzhouxiangellaceae bacterium]
MSGLNHTPIENRGSLRLRLALLLLVLHVSACDLIKKPEEAPPPEPEPVVEPEPEPPPLPKLPPPPPPEEAIQLALSELEAGRSQPALELLTRVQVEYGEQPMITWMIQQLTQPPEDVFGAEYEEYTVQRGDSMAQLSRVHLGHPLWFIMLSRYNNLTVPRNLDVGDVLRLPRQRPQLPDFLRAEQGSDNSINLAANDLLDQGRHDQALALLQSAMAADNLDKRGRQLLVRAWSLRLDQMMRRGQLDAAEEELSQLSPASNDAASRELITKLENQLKAQRHYQLGLKALERNHLEAAQFSFTQALRYQEDFTEARVRLRQTDHRITERDHQEAMRLLQAGERRAAASLWQRILERDPENRTAQEFLRRLSTGEL